MNRCAWIGKAVKHDKPWGHEFIWTGVYRGKEIYIKAGNRTSLKFNKNKDEVLYVQHGEVHVEYADEGHFDSPVKYPSKASKLTKGGLLNIQAGCPYRLSAITDCVVFEISDSRFREGRVIIEDDHGRDCSEAESNNLIFKPAKKA
tara:strand:- start:792 stop:1229 length:438 start_codon:yes stop_codon:yes gene_type:complete